MLRNDKKCEYNSVYVQINFGTTDVNIVPGRYALSCACWRLLIGCLLYNVSQRLNCASAGIKIWWRCGELRMCTNLYGHWLSPNCVLVVWNFETYFRKHLNNQQHKSCSNRADVCYRVQICSSNGDKTTLWCYVLLWVIALVLKEASFGIFIIILHCCVIGVDAILWLEYNMVCAVRIKHV